MSEDQNQTLVSMNNFLKNSGESIDITSEKYNKLMFLYNSALKIVNTKLEILKEELKEFYDYSPIEDITSRIKKPENVIEKLSRKDYAPTYANLINHLNDVAGIRIICNFKDDVYKIVELIESFQDIRIIKKKDFIKNPKKSGYRSIHLVTEVPINFSKGVVFIKVEIQIRTLGMNFWAVLEHKLNYKKNKLSEKDKKTLVKYANMINKIDEKLSVLSEEEFNIEASIPKKLTLN